MNSKLLNLFVFGNGGAFKEIAPLISKQGIYNIIVVVKSDQENIIKNQFYKTIEEDVFFKKNKDKEVNVAIFIGDLVVRKKIAELIKNKINFVVFPNFNFTDIDINLKNSEGNIIMPGTTFTDITLSIGSFNYFNFYCFIAHDVTVESFNTFSPSVKISGNCKIKSNNFLGTGCILFPNVSMENCSIGAGAVVKKKVLTNKIVDIAKSIIYEKR